MGKSEPTRQGMTVSLRYLLTALGLVVTDRWSPDAAIKSYHTGWIDIGRRAILHVNQEE